MKAFIIISLLALLTGCLNKPDNRSRPTSVPENDLIEINKSYITEDRKQISLYIEKSNFKFTETSTGLWYAVIDKGEGENIKTGDNVTYDYVCSLINGTQCYNGSNTLKIGYSGAESGVTEGLQLMRAGSEYIFVIPPYLAYGLTGDGNRIPGRAILVYRIRIRDIS